MNEASGEGGLIGSGRFDKFTERARKVLTLAQEEATRLNHNYIGTEHLLLGLVREGDGVAARVLANLGVELPRVRAAVEHIVGRGDRMIVGEVGLTPRAKVVIELGVNEARRLGHHYIGTEHLLLGLVHEGEGIAAGVLESLGVNLEKVRTQTVQVLSEGATGGEPGRRAAQEGAVRPTAGRALGRPPWWSYLLVTVEHAAAGASLRSTVTAVEGDAAALATLAVIPAADQPSLAAMLPTLGERGWELVAVDHLAAGTSLYVFKRPGHG